MNLSIKELNELIYSLGITASKGIMCDKELNVSLLNKLYDELTNRIAEEAIDEEVESDTYYVSNEEADEDYRVSMLQDEQRYESSVMNDYDVHLRKLKTRGYASQALLDYVDRKGAVSHKELETYYKQLTGSNSFSHILANLRIPYKNRKTQRYLAKTTNGKYVVRIASIHNWVEKSY